MFALLTEPLRIMYSRMRLIAILWRFIVFFFHSKTLVISVAVHPAWLFKPRHTVIFSVKEIYLVAFGLRPAVHFQTEKSFTLKRRTPGQLFILVLHKTSRCTNFRSELSQRTLLAGRAATHLNSWCSLELRILEENLSASLSKLREYSSSISALRRKNSCRSCSSWMRDSDCCSKHLNCSTSWLRISGHWKNRREMVIMGHMTGYNAHIAGTRPECLRCEKIWENPRHHAFFRKSVLKTDSFVMSWMAQTSLELVLPSEMP